ncbi:phage minor head protein [Aureimonas flava]|nr:phage minor head protein [Aureimonas flava]
MRYELARLAPSRRARTVLPPISASRGAETDYTNALRAMLRGLADEVQATILPEVEAEMARQRMLTQDAVRMGMFDRLLDVALGLALVAERTVTRILGLEVDRHTERWKASVRSTLGIDIATVVRNEDLGDYLETVTDRNVGLIRKLARDTSENVRQAVLNAILQGRTAKQLRGDLTDQFGISQRRAKVIARDQIAKVTSDLNQRRHTQAGITHYVWSTSHDERVRARHRALDGNEYEYGKPTGAEQGLPPGQPIQCRCVGRAIVIFDGERF